jgi:hypothetical protein
MSYKNTPYSDRSDIEKIYTNWKKVAGLYSRGEWSSAIVRAATAAEIAANLVVREELENQKSIDAPFVNHLMIWANGIQGKYQKLILPAIVGKSYEQDFKSVSSKISALNKARNKIVHGGEFGNSEPAHEIISNASDIIVRFVKPYHEEFKLDEIQIKVEEPSI